MATWSVLPFAIFCNFKFLDYVEVGRGARGDLELFAEVFSRIVFCVTLFGVFCLNP